MRPKRGPVGPSHAECDTLATEGLTIVRSKFMLVAVMLALAAYVPACCCWLETVSAWAVGAVEVDVKAGGHGCCGHHGMAGGDGGREQRTDRDCPVPGHTTDECGCGVQHRIGAQVVLTVLDFEPAMLGVARLEAVGDTGLAGRGASGGAWSADGTGTAGAGERTLLRLHCALTV